ncbi:MAG: hypothetical protein M1161_02835 [Candidatus Thermoplasmatota archaeon]|jgi:hypothetical protein|nr:hypothetical protein [Candidatus Thermoplasmatota archaeon]
MVDILDNKKGLVNSHGNDSEKSAPNFRYETIYNGSIDNLGKHLLNRQLSFKLLDNTVVTGKMISFGQYDIVVIDSKTGQYILIMKTSIVTVQGDLSPKKEMV